MFKRSLLGWVLLAGCGGEAQVSAEALRYGETLCGALEACECPSWFDSRESCVRDFAGRFDAVRRDGFAVDSVCFDKALGQLSGCPDLKVGLGCVALQRDGKLLAACVSYPELPGLPVAPCQSGLLCSLDGECRTPEQIGLSASAEGDACVREASPWCTPGLYCGAEGICEAWKAEGEACRSSFECMFQTYCRGGSSDGDGVCARQAVEGEPCDPRDFMPCGDPWSCDPLEGVCSTREVPLCDRLTNPRVRPTGGQ